MDQWRALAAKHGSSVEAVAVAFAALPSVVGKVRRLYAINLYNSHHF